MESGLSEIGQQELRLRLQRMPFDVVIYESIAKDVQVYAADRERLVLSDLSDLVICDLRAVNHRNRTLAEYLHHAVRIQDDRGVLIDTNAEIVWIIADRRDEAADASPLGEMLVDNDVLKEPEARRQPYAVLVRMRGRFPTDDHRRAHSRSTSARTGHY